MQHQPVAEANGTTVFKVTETGTTGAFSKALTGLQSRFKLQLCSLCNE